MNEKMKKNKPNLLWILRVLLLVALFLLICWYLAETSPSANYLCAAACQKPPQPSHVLEQYAIVLLFVLIVVISVIIKPHIDQRTIHILSVLLLFLIIVFILLSISVVNCPNISQCFFNPYGSIICSSKLHAGTSELDLSLVNHLNHDIQINGIKCIRTSSLEKTGQSIFVEPFQEPVLLKGGFSSITINGSETKNKLYCTDENGLIPANTPSWPSDTSFECFKIYINYTDISNGSSTVADGVLIERYISW
jgi:uncharacterized membrane protein YhaH (DUF805 family)